MFIGLEKKYPNATFKYFHLLRNKIMNISVLLEINPTFYLVVTFEFDRINIMRDVIWCKRYFSLCVHPCVYFDNHDACGIYLDNNNKWKESITDTLLQTQLLFFLFSSTERGYHLPMIYVLTLYKNWRYGILMDRTLV